MNENAVLTRQVKAHYRGENKVTRVDFFYSELMNAASQVQDYNF